MKKSYTPEKLAAVCRYKKLFSSLSKLYVPKGFFTPPFETEDSLRERLSVMYEKVSVTSVEGMGCFCCKKA